MALPPLIVRLGLHDQFLLEESEGFRMDVVGRTIAQARGDPALAPLARDRFGLGVLIDPDTWRNQWPPEDRPVNFQKARFASTHALDFRRRPLSAAEEDAYVRATLEEEVAARASIFVPPYHVAGGPACLIRGLDLRLARRTVARVRSLRLNEPRNSDPFPRAGQVFVCICVGAADLLDPVARQMLAHLYAPVDADGYLLKVVGLSEHTRETHVRAVADLAFTLKLLTGRAVVLGGGKNLAYAFVGAGLDAAMLGIGEGEVFAPGSRARGGGARPVYHAGILRSVHTRGASAVAIYRAEILFARRPCDCGHHRRDQPPQGQRERKLHTLSERLRDFNTASSWSESEARPRLARRVAAANRLAARRGYPALPGSFLVVAEQAELTRAGFRRADVRR
jgi:hypothetical protein